MLFRSTAFAAKGQKLQPMTTELIHWVVWAIMEESVKAVIIWPEYLEFAQFWLKTNSRTSA
jgi:hypothetical protein